MPTLGSTFRTLFSYFFLDTASVETYMERQRRVQDKGKEMITQIQTVSESLKGNSDKLGETLSTELHKQFSTIFKK